MTTSERVSRNTLAIPQTRVNKTIVFLGNSQVGKTSILIRFTKKNYKDEYIETLGVNYYAKENETEYGKVQYHLWDSSGSEIEDGVLPANTYKNADAFKKRSEGILNFAKSVGILVIALFALTKIDYGKLDSAAKILGVIVGVMATIWILMTLLGKLNVGIFSGSGGAAQMPITNLIASLATIITALKTMQDMDYEKAKQNVKILGAMLAVLAVVSIALAKLAPQLSKGATLFIGIGISIKLLVSALKTLNDMDLE